MNGNHLSHMEFSTGLPFEAQNLVSYTVLGKSGSDKQDVNKMTRNTSDVTKNDIIIANQVSNESLLSKTDIVESAMDSKRALPPKFNASVNPFSKIRTGTKSQSKTDLMEQKKIAYRIRRRRRINKMDKFETAINAAMLNSMASKDATMTLECIESREGGVE